jgi:3-oxoacyl-[acyl-carrier-protein] synthase-3
MYNTVLVVGSETLSRAVDWKDRSTCVLFGDGAGAVILRGSERYGGILSTVLGSDGSGGELLEIPAGGSKHPTTLDTLTSNMHTIKMNGREVYRFATKVMAEAAKQAITRANLPLEEVDLLIPHQANVRIIDSAAKALKLPPEKVFVNLERYGNTSAASIPIALCEAIDSKRVNPGDHIVFVGFGAGLTWASCAVEWTEPTIVQKLTRQKAAQSHLRYTWAHVKSGGHRLLRRIDSAVSKVIDKVEGEKERI